MDDHCVFDTIFYYHRPYCPLLQSPLKPQKILYLYKMVAGDKIVNLAKKVIKWKTSVSMCLWRNTSKSGVPEQYLTQYDRKNWFSSFYLPIWILRKISKFTISFKFFFINLHKIPQGAKNPHLSIIAGGALPIWFNCYRKQVEKISCSFTQISYHIEHGIAKHKEPSSDIYCICLN